jgi:hypothetical protein
MNIVAPQIMRFEVALVSNTKSEETVYRTKKGSGYYRLS